MFINFKAPRVDPLPVQCSVLFSTAICWQWPGSRLPPWCTSESPLATTLASVPPRLLPGGQWAMGIHTVQFHNIILYEA